MTDLKKLAADLRDEAAYAPLAGRRAKLLEIAAALDAYAQGSAGERLEYLLNLCRARAGTMSNAQMIAETDYVFAAPPLPSVDRKVLIREIDRFGGGHTSPERVIEVLRALGITVEDGK